MFKVGQIVKCTDNLKRLIGSTFKTPPICIGKEYVISGITECQNCGNLFLDVGFSTGLDWLRCDCGNDNPANGIYYCNSKRFVVSDRKTISPIITDK